MPRLRNFLEAKGKCLLKKLSLLNYEVKRDMTAPGGI